MIDLRGMIEADLLEILAHLFLDDGRSTLSRQVLGSDERSRSAPLPPKGSLVPARVRVLRLERLDRRLVVLAAIMVLVVMMVCSHVTSAHDLLLVGDGHGGNLVALAGKPSGLRHTHI